MTPSPELFDLVPHVFIWSLLLFHDRYPTYLSSRCRTCSSSLLQWLRDDDLFAPARSANIIPDNHTNARQYLLSNSSGEGGVEHINTFVSSFELLK